MLSCEEPNDAPSNTVLIDMIVVRSMALETIRVSRLKLGVFIYGDSIKDIFATPLLTPDT